VPSPRVWPRWLSLPNFSHRVADLEALVPEENDTNACSVPLGRATKGHLVEHAGAA